MREILFRGKKTGFNEWVKGYISSPCKDTMYTMVEEGTKTTWFVDADTIGQYTGLTDKNGKKIFEGDIVQSIELELKGVIIFDEYCRFMIKDIATKSTYLLARNNEEIKVIGNIHDNPELLKGE